MANRNNSGRTKKSHGFRPYDTSNSFVKRITAKVSEILPQPTSWVSRWFSPASKLNTRGHDEVDEEDDDEEERQPPSKRLCFGTSETSEFSHQNNINRLSGLDRGSGEISPILSRNDEDRAVPGPSGLHLRHFVSSTPAVRQATPSPSKVNLREKARDDASDESETTSGCSSLVPGTERPHTRQEQLATPTPVSPSIPNASTIRRLSTNTLKASSLLNRSSTMNLSTSSQPPFDTYVFNNPLNRSGIRRRSIADESCFYPGQTTFGGASSRLNSSIDQPRVVNVKVSPANKQLQQDIIGTSALRILKALEQFSTPVLDAKRIPLRKDGANTERKRKAPQPYEELIYPSMPDLLRVKRKEQELERTRIQPDNKAASTSSKPSPSSSQAAKPMSVPTSSASTSADIPTTSQVKYSLRPENSKDRHIGSIKGRNKDEDFESERVPEVNLPNVKLQLSSLPKFDINVPLPQPKASTQSPNSLSTRSNPPFKFSEPEVPKIQPLKEDKILPVNTFKFSEPLEPLEFKKNTTVNSTNEKLSSSVLQMKNPSPALKSLKEIKSPDKKTEIHSNFKFEVKPTTEMKNASVMDVLNKKSFGDNITTAIGDWSCSSCSAKNSVNQSKCVSCGKGKSFLSKDTTSSPISQWDCKKCSLKNPSSETKCKSCGLDKNEIPSSTTFKGFEGFKKPKDTWECSSCLVNNKNTSDSCAACSTPRSKVTSSKSTSESSGFKTQDKKLNDVGSTTVTTPLLNSLKRPSGSWECNTCLVRNKNDDNKCVACSALKPGSSATAEKVKPMFSFGIPPSSTNETNLSNSQNSTTPSQFTFGIPAESKAAVSSTNLKSEAEKKNDVPSADSTTTVSSSVVSSTPAPLINSIKKPEGSWECGTCLVQNKKDITTCVACNTLKPGATPAEKPKPTFSFGIPSSSTPTTNNALFSSSISTGNNMTNSSNIQNPQFTFGNPPEGKKMPSSLFGFPSNESKSENEYKPFSFINSDQSKEKETAKAPMTNLFTFGNPNPNKESKNEDMNECDDKPAKKRVSFGNPLTFEKQATNDNSTATFGNFGATKTNEISSSSNFAFAPKSTPFENNASMKKEATPSSNSLFAFGSSNTSITKPNDLVSVSEPTKPVAFGAVSDKKSLAGLSNSNAVFGSSSLGGFKAPETENKPFAFMSNATQASNQQTGGFTFNAPAAPASEFASQPNQTAPGPGPSLFSQQQAATPAPLFTQPQEQKPFLFNAPAVQQPQAPLFTFTAAPAQTGAHGTAFGSFSAPSAPKFDPNIKPSFNFTGGATPSFSASPTPTSLEVGGDNKRKVRKAIRRTTQHR